MCAGWSLSWALVTTTLRRTAFSISNSAEHDSKVDTARLLQLVLGIAINCEHKDSKMCGATSCCSWGVTSPVPGPTKTPGCGIIRSCDKSVVDDGVCIVQLTSRLSCQCSKKYSTL